MLRVTYSHRFEDTVLFLWLFFFFWWGGGADVLSIKRHVVNLSFIRPFKKKDLITFKIHLLGSEDSTKPLGM